MAETLAALALGTAVLTLLTAAFGLALAFNASRKADATGAQVQEIHLQINSRLDELLRTHGASQRAEGVIEGAAQEREKTNP